MTQTGPHTGEPERRSGRDTANRDGVVEHQAPDGATARWVRVSGALAMFGGAVLTAGALLVEFGNFADLSFLMSAGNALSAGAGLALLFLPIGLLASGVGGRGTLPKAGVVCLAIGISIVSLVDVPTILDPSNVEAGGAFGPVGLVLLSAGFLAWFAAIRRVRILGGWRKYIFLAAGLWFFVTFPAIQLPLFVIPTGRPSFALLAGVLGMLQILMGVILRERVRNAKRQNAQ